MLPCYQYLSMQVSKVIDKRSWKRCTAHVHISRLIQRLQIPNSKDMFLERPNQMRGREGPKRCVLAEVHELSGIKNEATSAPITCHSATVNNSHELKNGMSATAKVILGFERFIHGADLVSVMHSIFSQTHEWR